MFAPYPTPKRIAILSVHTCPLATLGGKKTGGMNVYVRDFGRELSRQGVQVDVFTRSQDDCQPRVKHDLGYGARVIHIPAGPERPIPIAEIEDHLDEFVQGVVDFAAAEGLEYDIIHSHYWLSGLVAEGLRRAWGAHIPVLHMFHTLAHMKNRIAISDKDRANDARIAGEMRVIHEIADRVIAATPAEEAQLKWLYQADLSKVRVIPPGVDLERFSPIGQRAARERLGICPDSHNIIFAGRIEPLKGVDTLLRAIHLIKQRSPAVADSLCVSIIGGDPWTDDPDEEIARLQKLHAELGLHDVVNFLGAKDQDILPEYYAAAELVVMPSHYESFGLVALEAMAMGTPVIASEVGGLAFLVKDGETGFHVPCRDPEALAERIFNMLVDEDCRAILGQQARRHAEQFAWPHIVDQMITAYSEALAERTVLA